MSRREADIIGDYQDQELCNNKKNDSRLRIRDAVHQQELSSLHAQKEILLDKLDRAHEDLEECLVDNEG